MKGFWKLSGGVPARGQCIGWALVRQPVPKAGVPSRIVAEGWRRQDRSASCIWNSNA